jgi:hypothetical protein
VKKILVALALLALPFTARAAERDAFQFPLAIDYDLDSADFVYPASQGRPLGTLAATSRVNSALATLTSNVKVQTSGVSTTVAASTASTEPFAALQAGDFIRLRMTGPPAAPGTWAVDTLQTGDTPWLKVTAKASANSITVSKAINIVAPGVGFEWRRATVGAEVGYGWIPMRGFDKAVFRLAIQQESTTDGISARVECRQDWPGTETASYDIVYPYPGATCNFGTLATNECVFTDAGLSGRLAVTIDNANVWHECRMGIQLTSTDDGGDTGADMEQVSIDFIGVQGGVQ